MVTKKYEYHRIERLAEQLKVANVAPAIINDIMDGGDKVLRKTPPAKKADWLRGAMLKMNNLLDVKTRKAVREGCACCLGGKRLKISQTVFKENNTLEERVKAVSASRVVGNVTLQSNGEILALFDMQKEPPYRCYCLGQAKEPLPITYCFCCGGHVKHHLQVALGKNLDCTTRSSALSSGGKFPCAFSFKILE